MNGEIVGILCGWLILSVVVAVVLGPLLWVSTQFDEEGDSRLIPPRAYTCNTDMECELQERELLKARAMKSLLKY